MLEVKVQSLGLDRTSNTPVVILLTDGLPNQVPYAEDGTVETTILRYAVAAKAAGVVMYTIGVGVPNSPDINQRINPAGAKVFTTACWLNPASEWGQCAAPISAYLSGGAVSMAA